MKGVETAEREGAGEGQVALFAGGEETVVGRGDRTDVWSERVGFAWSSNEEVGPVGEFVVAYWFAGCEVVELGW